MHIFLQKKAANINKKKVYIDVKKNIDNSSQRTIQENASRRLARKLFPNEIWDTENGVKISKTRRAESEKGNEPAKLKREIYLIRTIVSRML